MPNPKRKISRSKRDMRKAHWFNSLGKNTIITCDNCNEKMIAHRACPSCGYYRGKHVMNPQKSA
jgi:large subunit ribosomal protein L32